VLAQKAGLSALQIGIMSLFVFAGSAQFIGVSMIAAGASPLAIVATTFTVNLRHFLMSSSLAMFLGQSSRKLLSLFAYGVTDESFAVNLTRFHQGGWDAKRGLVVNHTSNLAWVASTILGGYAGNLIPERAFGIDYALNAMFICLLVFQLRGKKYVIVSLLSGILAVALALMIPGNSYIVLASIVAATVVVLGGRLRAFNGK